MRHGIRLLMAWLAMAMVMQAHAAQPIPEPLRDWQAWVLQGQEFRACPFLATRTPGDASAHICAWPGALTLDLTASGGTFRQRWQVYAESWIRLPGSLEHWPRDLRLNGAAAAVVAREGYPQVFLPAGTHEVSGRFAWDTRPEQLPVPAQTAIVQLTLDGRAVAQPERPGDAIWLGQRRAAVEREQLDLTVHRLLRDDIPARLSTSISLYVSGAGREVLLGPVLPAGFVPLALEGSLPARLESDGRLRVQLRPGRFTLQLDARGPAVAQTVTRPQAAEPWPADEVWSFQGVDRLRVAAPEGAESIDPAQANVPGGWRSFPAFRLSAGGSLAISERSRALANPDDNQLQLSRQIWLDFNHDGYTVTDQVTGRLNRDWRLDMAPPYLLESARAWEQNLLVTSAPDDASGIELRDRNLQLSTIARVEGARAGQPATGWSTRFESAGGELHLPPGHRLLGAPGADFASGSWIDGWGLWNLFGVLVVIVLAHWVAGRAVAIAAGIALLLLYQEAPAMIWLWANAIAAIALFRAAPEGRLRTFAARYRVASFAVLVLALLPLLIGQLRLAFYPQLDSGMDSFRVMMGSSLGDGEVHAIRADILTKEMAEAALPAAPPPMGAPRSQSSAVDAVDVQQDVPPGSFRGLPGSVANRYAAGTLLQAGPGVPNWHFRTYRYGWSGPVEAAQQVRFIWLGPVAMGIWRILGVLATALFALLLARGAFQFALNVPGLPPSLRRSLGGTAAVMAAVLLLIPAPPAQAQSIPSQEMLNELRNRLTAPPGCRNSCAEIASATVRASGDRLEVELTVSALADVAVALPQAGDRWQLERVEVDGRAAPFVMRESGTSAWLPLTRGAHQVTLAGRLANAETVQLGFPQPPRAISVSTSGWDAAGVTSGRLLSGSLELIRRRAAGSAAADLSASEFPAFVQLTRTFRLDLDWSIHSTVERIAPRAAPLQVEVPLVPGESVLTAGATVRDGRITAALGRGVQAFAWDSLLQRSETLALTLPADAARSEHWIFAVGPEWHLTFDGLPPSLPEQDTGQWIYHFVPRAGETLNLAITRPAPAPGRTLAIDSVEHSSEIGKRSITGSLNLQYRSTQAGRHTLTLPPELRVTQVLIDGESVPVRPDNGQLPLALLAGTHNVRIEWNAPRGAGFLSRPDAIDLGTPASNVTTRVTLPADRWPLFARGAGVGTAILYWGELVIFVLVALALARLVRSPLKFHEWLLLGLGLSTLSWPVFATVAAWLLVMRWRAGWNHATASRLVFHTVQTLLALFTVIALSSLVFSGVRYGLLARPDMSLNAPGGLYAEGFQWFLDRSASALPVPAVISVPMWVYRLLMFAWAAWIAVQLRHWLPAAWQAWTQGGFWRGKLVTPPPPPARNLAP
ncbi:MAG TPA: hypothetical protein VNQ32_06115 [Steroidobacteraceae bacterium]|nr:hypothetical protein [Steroidobacteraceae bacterium]